MRSFGRFIVAFWAAGAGLCGVGCKKQPEAPARGPDTVRSNPSDSTIVSRSDGQQSPDSVPLVVFLGTSLTAGYGLPNQSLAYPALIQKRIDSLHLKYRAVNAGLSGETSAGALRRVDWVMQQGKVAVLVIETGANDGLRGNDIDSTRANIQAIITKAKAARPGIKIVIVGMEALPNLGREYTTKFRAIYKELADSNGAVLIPFLLADVAGIDSLNQADGIHPTARGQEIVARTVWHTLEGLLR